ncbi:MAG: ATP-dependent zinc metalloprotease FtsH [Gammaproteobacteria bacterium]
MAQPTPEKPNNRAMKWLPYWFIFMLFVLAVYTFQRFPAEEKHYEIPYSQFKSLVADRKVAQVEFQGSQIKGRLVTPEALGPQGQLGQDFRTEVPAFGDDSLLPLLDETRTTVTVKAEAAANIWATLFITMVPWIVLFLLFYWAYRRTSSAIGGRLGGPGELKKFLETPGRKAEVPDVTFADVAGQENAKREVMELIEFLKDPDRFRKLGAEVPRGILLMGAPGTGKTLMARALAGEAGVPFFSISGSEFIEVFVGVGASRVRHLFEAAKKSAPSIIFIDELDSVGRTRGTGLGGGHDEREQTLNQILAEMDGFAGHEAVIVIAATNRPDVLDPALLRPGRFDRHVTLDLPDLNDRIAILKVHTRKIPLASDVDLKQIAAGTPGFSGADLKNLVNEAAMFAARANLETVSMVQLDEARDKLLMGTVRTLAIQPEERHRLAVHEAGHTLVAYFLPHADPLYKVTIIPRGRALGGTQQLPEEERHTLPEDYLRDRLAVMLGGRCAEKLLLGTVSSGADDDIHQTTNLARAMVARWGMSEDIGPIDLRESEEHPFLGREIAQPRRYSEHSAQSVDQAIHKLIHEAEDMANRTLQQHRVQLDKLIAELETRESLQRADIERCLGPSNKTQALGLSSV